MTWFSAVSLALVAGVPGQQQAAREDPVWQRVKGAVVRLNGIGQPPGLAVLIDSRGLFLAHRAGSAAQPLVGLTDSGSSLLLNTVATDEQTQLSLLRADAWAGRAIQPVSVADKLAAGSRLLAVTVTGPVLGELVTNDVVGQMRPTLRYVPLSEIRLEANVNPAGAIAFDTEGRLVGLLGATLTSRAAPSRGPLGQAKALTTTEASDSAPTPTYGPQGLTVAYSLGPTVIARVVAGLLSPSHRVEHPSVGMFFKGSTVPGALVEEVLPGSPADQAGVKVGDLITEFRGKAIKSPIDLAMGLFDCSVGEQVKVVYQRAGVPATTTITVASASTGAA